MSSHYTLTKAKVLINNPADICIYMAPVHYQVPEYPPALNLPSARSIPEEEEQAWYSS